jgi:hypothetical protein
MAGIGRGSLTQIILLLAALSMGGGAPTGAQQSAPPAANPIEQLGWLAGGTWTTEEPSSSGPPLTVRFHCRWAPTKNALLFDVSFLSAGRETPQYDGMYVWHPGKGKLVLWQVNRKGEVAEGELTVNGKEMDQTAHVSHPDGTAHFLKAHYTRLDDDSFRFKAFFRLSESEPWQDALDLVYKRVPGS